MGLPDTKTTKDLLLKKRLDGMSFNEQEEKLLDLLNRMVIFLPCDHETM